MTAPIDVGRTTQLFFDDTLTEMLLDLTQVMHQPTRHPGNPLVRGDKPWEQLLYFVFSSGNVLYNPRENLFRLWYEDLSFDHAKFLADPTALTWDYMFMHYLYATSEDGIHWEKPALNVIPDWGPNTNVVFGDATVGKIHVMSVIDDPKETDSRRRFKGMFVHADNTPGERYHIGLAWSPDGIHWTVSPELPQFGPVGPHLNDVIILSFDPTIDRYVLFTRHPAMGGPPLPPKLPGSRSFIRPIFPGDPAREGRRRIYRTESRDLLHWDEPRVVLAPDGADNWDDQYFGMVQFRRGNLHLGCLHVFHTVENSWNPRLVFSHDGWTWQQAGGRRPFLDYGPVDAWDRWCINITSPPIERDDQLWFYYGGAINHHDYWFAHDDVPLPEARDLRYVDHGMGLATLRLDGFISATANLREGILITRPIRSDGGHLIVNCHCRERGYLAVELTDLDDNVLPGYSRADCDVFTGDTIRHVVSWHGEPGITGARDGLKVRFYLRQADLYTFRFDGGV